MHPLIRAGAASLLLFVLGARAGGAEESAEAPALSAARAADGLSAPCPSGLLPDGPICVPIPSPDETGGDELVAFRASHHDRHGRYEVYDQIPRRPDRPPEYRRYRYPIEVPDNVPLTMSGYDLDRPEAEQRRGPKFSHVGHGGIDLPAPRGAPVRLLSLEHQEGLAEVLFVGKLFGTTVVTKHALREGGRLREYLILYGHLDGIAPGISRGTGPLEEGALLGFVGDTSSPGIVHLHLETRRVRDDVEISKVEPGKLVADEISIVCDPRNVLPVIQSRAEHQDP